MIEEIFFVGVVGGKGIMFFTSMSVARVASVACRRYFFSLDII